VAPRQTWKDRARRAWLARIAVAVALAAMGVWAPAALAGTADLVVTAHANRQVTLRPCSVLECRGTSLQVRVSVRNRGPDPATNVVVRLSGLDDRDNAPTVDCTAAGAATPDVPPGCSFATIAPRARITVRFRFSVCCPFGQPDETITHGATVTSDSADPDHANDAAFAVTRVVVAPPRPPKPDHHLRTARVLVLDFDPLTDAGEPLTRAHGWNDPQVLTSRYAADAGVASAGLVRHRIVRDRKSVV